jgi:hypothetical protein
MIKGDKFSHTLKVKPINNLDKNTVYSTVRIGVFS